MKHLNIGSCGCAKICHRPGENVKKVRKSVLIPVWEGQREIICYLVRYALSISIPVLLIGLGKKLSHHYQGEDGCSTKQRVL